MATTREQVAVLLAEGLSRAEIARRLGISKPTVTYHCTRLGLPPKDRFAKRYDWAEIQRYYDQGHSMRECQARFGFSHETWHAARQRGDILTRPQAMSIEVLLSAPRNRPHIRKRLIAAGLKPDACERCGLCEWQGKPLPLQLHHRNGVGDDNRLENLEILCPNCHSQTENWGGRNKRHLRVIEAAEPPEPDRADSGRVERPRDGTPSARAGGAPRAA